MAPYFLRLLGAAASLVCVAGAHATVSVDPYYAALYSLTNLGAAPGVPALYGGLTFQPSNPNTLLVGGRANASNAAVYGVAVVRDASGHITGFAGTAGAIASAPRIDGGLASGPGDVLFYTSYPDNQIGQIEPGSSGSDRLVLLGMSGATRSVGALAFVPSGLPGAGSLKLVHFTSGLWYDARVSPDGNGTYNILDTTFVMDLGTSLQGIVYVPPGHVLFPEPTVLIASYSLFGADITAYEVDADGDPIPATRRPFLSGVTGAMGAAVDPETGDFLFTALGEKGSEILLVRAPALVPVPEASSWMLLLLGLALLSAALRRRAT